MANMGGSIKKPSMSGMSNMGHLKGEISDAILSQGHRPMAGGGFNQMAPGQANELGASSKMGRPKGVKAPKSEVAAPMGMAKVRGGAYGQ